MITKENISIIESLRKIKSRDLIYPGLFILFFIIVIIVFFFAMQFISKNINKAFSPEESAPSQALDIEKYKLVAKKLNMSVSPIDNVVVAPAEVPTTQAVATSTPIATLNKKDITIMIKNSTSKKGVATALAKTLEDAGFATPKTGNEQKLYSTTTILLKESRNIYQSILLEAVRKTYPDAIITTTPETSAVDATVIIGAR